MLKHDRLWNYRWLLASAGLANFAGAAIVFFYFAYIDLETFRANKGFWRGTQADWLTFLVVMGLLCLLAGLVNARLARPLATWEARLRAGGDPEQVPQPVRRRLVGFPLTLALVYLAAWVIAGLFFALGGLKPLSTDMATFWRTFLGVAVVGGLIFSALTFLMAESLWRSKLSLFYPAGGLEAVGAPRITVAQRYILAFLLTGIAPLAILAAAGRNAVLAAMDNGIDPYAALDRLHLNIVFVVGVSVITNVALGTLTARSLLRPLGRLRRAMRSVAQGELAVRLPAESNDELGDLSDHFNRMLDDMEQAGRMRDLFGRYVSREVAAQVLQHGCRLGGESVQATALFADIRDFTSLSERLPPQEVVGLLNRYYTRMVDVIVAEGGLVNKFGGDSLLAVFGAPIRQPDHAVRAVRAAWQMTRALAEFNAEQTALGLPMLTIGIGISSGEMVAGHVGAASRLEYTVIGDAVNLASRLQMLTKELGAPVLLSEATRRRLSPGWVSVQPRDLIAVRGRHEPTLVYELCGVAV
jgi:adenylate cyclase